MNVNVEEYLRSISLEKLSSYIDHTLLKPNTTFNDVVKAVEYTRKYGFACLVLSPYHALRLLRDRELSRNIRVCSVIGFPMGYMSTRTKFEEARELIDNGVSEIDMVMNIQAFKEGLYDKVVDEISKIVELAHKNNVAVKVIIETGLLSDEEKIKATELVVEGGADYVKTCTGYLGGRATIHDVILLKKASRGRVKVKASGGIRHLYDAIALILAGADRLGTSSGVQIVEEYLRFKEKT